MTDNQQQHEDIREIRQNVLDLVQQQGAMTATLRSIEGRLFTDPGAHIPQMWKKFGEHGKEIATIKSDHRADKAWLTGFASFGAAGLTVAFKWLLGKLGFHF